MAQFKVHFKQTLHELLTAWASCAMRNKYLYWQLRSLW